MSLLRMQRPTRLRADLRLPLTASPSARRPRSAGDLEPDGGRIGHSLVSVDRNVMSGWLGTVCLGAAAGAHHGK